MYSGKKNERPTIILFPIKYVFRMKVKINIERLTAVLPMIITGKNIQSLTTVQ